MLATALSYRIVTQNFDRSLLTTARQPLVKRETEYYLATIGTIRNADDFLNNDRVYRYAMKAFGLENMSFAKAFMRRVLTEGVENPRSFANLLSDRRYREFAETFNFAALGSAATVFDRAQQPVADRYIRQTLEEQAGGQNEGVRLALYFERQAPRVTSTLGLLADPALTKVVQTVLRLPASTSALDIDRQVDIINSRLDIADLQDPAKLKKLLVRFTNLWDIQNSQSASSSGASLLLSGQRGFSVNLLQSLQGLRLGGR